MDERNYDVLIVAPQGQDARLTQKVLSENMISSEIFQDLASLAERINGPCGAVLVSEEAMTEEQMNIFELALRHQPLWSDIPIILVSLGRNSDANIKQILEFFGSAGNITVLDRPFNISTVVTMVKVALRARQKQYEIKLLLKEKNDALAKRDEFMSIASHELRTPITALRLQVQLRKRSLQKGDLSVFSPEKVKSLLETTDNQVERLYRLIDEMLDVSRIDNGKLVLNKTRCELGDIVSSVAEMMGPHFLATAVELKVKFESDAQGEWDRNRIEQVLINLLTNALKYGDSRPVCVVVGGTGEYAEVRVEDQGKGISREDIGRVFDRFERAKNVGAISGLGLGLFISREIVKMHEGNLFVKSEVGKGSTFIMQLPRSFPPMDEES